MMKNLFLEGNSNTRIIEWEIRDQGYYTRVLFFSVLALSLFLLLSLLPSSAMATYRPILMLDNNCTVTVLNRTVNADSSGKVILENVPSTRGKIRARATCVRDGVTVVGVTDYFEVPRNATVKMGQFYEAVEEITPVKLIILGGRSISFNKVGATQRLGVLASYSDGSIKTVTDSIFGTNYISSNPSVATVDVNGVITAVASGRALITVRKDGLIAAVTANVVTSGDSDGDGISDDFELANGLDPSDPVDAFEDRDKDGLSALDEYQLGTLIDNKDSDGDGISDGEEIIPGADGFISNPLLFDTDGDGLSDGVEVAVGSDPSDPGDTNLADAVISIAVASSMEIIRNTIDNETARRLIVTAQLIDGSDLEVSSIDAINYNSSNLAVVSFGAEKGEIFANQEGFASVSVDLGSLSESIDITVTDFEPAALSYLSLPTTGFANNVEFYGGYTYVAAGADGLYVIDVRDPYQPILINTVPLEGNGNDIKVVPERSLLLIAGGSAGLHILDISDPEVPELVYSVDTPGDAIDLAVQGQLVYIADRTNVIQVVSISPDIAPAIIATVPVSGSAWGVAIAENILAVVYEDSNLADIVLLDSNLNPISSAGFELTDTSGIAVSQVFDVLIKENALYVVSDMGLFSIDISAPLAPELSVNFDTMPMTNLFLWDELLFTDWTLLLGTPLSIWNVDLPQSPVFASQVFFRSLSGLPGDANGFSADSLYMYMVSSLSLSSTKGGVSGGSSTFYIGQYREIFDDLGIKPLVSITAPNTDQQFLAGEAVKVVVDASDDVGVERVEFLINGEIVYTDIASPYEYELNIPLGSNAIVARAFDFGNNISDEAEVSISATAESEAPNIELTWNSNVSELVPGDIVNLTAIATDNVAVERVEYIVNGEGIATRSLPPYQHVYQVDAIGDNVILAEAYDYSGNVGNTEVFISVSPDPGTLVVGNAVDVEGNSLVGANIECRGIEGVSDANGEFGIAAVPAFGTTLSCSASYTNNTGDVWLGSSSEVDIVRSGITDVGTILISSVRSVLILGGFNVVEMFFVAGWDLEPFIQHEISQRMPNWVFDHYNAALGVPDAEFLQQFDLVWMIERTHAIVDLEANTTSWGTNSNELGDVLYDYVQTGGNLLLNYAYAEARSDSSNVNDLTSLGGTVLENGWGALESIDLFVLDTDLNCSANTAKVSVDSFIEHPLTIGLSSLSQEIFQPCLVPTDGLATVVAQSVNGDPLIGYKILPDGQRIVTVAVYAPRPHGISVMGGAGTVVGSDENENIMWENILRWTAHPGGPLIPQ